MSDFEAYLVVSLGVLVAVIFPVVKGFVSNSFQPKIEGAGGLPPWVKKYGGLLLFSAITGVIALAIFRQAQPDTDISWYAAFLTGFGWESAIEKFFTSPT